MSQHHDPVHPEGSHLDTEVIADLQIDALDVESAAHAQAHLDGCPQCREVADALEQVGRSLSALPPVTVPDGVAARWAAALAAEPVLVSSGGGATVVPMGTGQPARSGVWAGRGLAIAASGAGLLLVAALAYPMLTNNDSGSTGSGDPTGLAAPNTLGATEGDVSAIPAATTSGTQYRTAALDAQVTTQLTAFQQSPTFASSATTEGASSPPPSPTEPSATGTKSGPLLLVDRAAELACLSHVLTGGSVPLLVDVATYQSQPAVVIVVPTDNDPNKMDVWVLARHCTQTDYRVLYWLRTDRP